MNTAPPSPSRSRIVGAGAVALALLATLGVGLALRLFLAGYPVRVPDFEHYRHLHTHLGTYAVLFPLMWWSWARAGEAVPGRTSLGIYAGAVLLSAVGFARSGYGPLSIAGSTVVLLVWLRSAWLLRARVGPRGGWLGSVPLAILFAALMVPLVARTSSVEAARALVRSFLGLLVLGALVPTALAGLGTRAPPPLLWLAAATAGALSLGASDLPGLPLGLAVVAVLVLGTAWRATGRPVLRAAWALGALGVLAVGVGLVPLDRQLAVAGTHFLVLGPLLLGLGGPLLPRRLPDSVQGLALALAAAMAATIALQSLAPGPWWGRLSAWTGAGLALLWVGLAGVALVGHLAQRSGQRHTGAP